MSLSLWVAKPVEEGITSFLLDRGATGIEELEEDSTWKQLRAYFKRDGNEKRLLRALQRYLRSLQGMTGEVHRGPVETTALADQDWSENWKRFFNPLQVTPRIMVKPPWAAVPRKGATLVIDILPGMAFGTGTHATTRLCLQALEKALNRRDLSVLDVGTGSGILAIAAARLGARQAIGLDIDPVAVKMARENAERNGVSSIVRVRQGGIGRAKETFDVVVANLDFKRLRRLRSRFLRRLGPGGILIISGILKEDGEAIRQSYTGGGALQRVGTRRKEEWVSFSFRKRKP